MHPELEALLALQEKDQAVTATDAALAALAPELATLDEAQATAERALAVVRPRCVGLDVHAVPHGVPYAIDVVRGARPSAAFVQLGLSFEVARGA